MGAMSHRTRWSFLPHRGTRRTFSRLSRWGICFAVMLLLAACGQVVTVVPPTATPPVQATAPLSLATVPPRPTVTLAVPTATVPNTPTPTPTPIVHVVQPGETLIAIALKYGVTVAALQSANGIDDPSTLQVSQELVIPTDEESQGESLELLLPTPSPVPFAVEGLNCYAESAGSLWCLGEVVNSTDAALENVEVRLTLHGDAGQELMGGVAQAALDLIRPGERAPFGIIFTSPPESFDRPLVVPIRAESSSDPGSRYATLELSAVQASMVGSLFEVTGSVTNPGQLAAGSVMIVVTTYDDQGIVTGFRQTRLPDALAPGATTDFAISLMPSRGAPVDYTLAVQGQWINP